MDKGLGYSGGLPAPAGPMVARSTCNDPSSRFTPVIVTAEPTLMSVIRAARAIQIAVSGPMVIFRSPSLLSYVDGPPWQALFWRFERFGRLRSYVRPLSVRSICPRALMKSDDRDPYQPRELFADDNRRVVPGLRWRPCRSSRLVALTKLEPLIPNP